MKSSVEVRWFFKPSPPIELQRLSQNTIEQLDWYFVPSSERLGIKIRNTRVELKQLIETYGAISFSENICGNVERWVKFQADLNPRNNLLFPELLRSLGWLEVIKTRYLHYYSYNAGEICEVNEREYKELKEGAQFEIVSIKLNDQFWWSIGCEVFGETIEKIEWLSTVLNKALIKSQIILTVKDSCSYPTWLGSLRI